MLLNFIWSTHIKKKKEVELYKVKKKLVIIF